MTLLSEAQAQLAARKAAEQAKDQADRQAFRTAAFEALRAALKREDGTLPTAQEIGLTAQTVQRVNLADRLVVVTIDGVSLSVREDEPGKWVVRLVRMDTGQWTPVGDRIRSLADLGAALAA